MVALVVEKDSPGCRIMGTSRYCLCSLPGVCNEGACLDSTCSRMSKDKEFLYHQEQSEGLCL